MKYTEVLHQNLQMQGFTTDGENMYWSFTDSLVKTKKSGLMLRQVPIPLGHLGDIVYYNGKIYDAKNVVVDTIINGISQQQKNREASQRAWNTAAGVLDFISKL